MRRTWSPANGGVSGERGEEAGGRAGGRGASLAFGDAVGEGEGEGGGGFWALWAAPASPVHHGVTAPRGAVYTRLLITHTAVRRAAAARQSGETVRPAGAAAARG